MNYQLGDTLIATKDIWDRDLFRYITSGTTIVIDDLFTLPLIPGMFSTAWRKL